MSLDRTGADDALPDVLRRKKWASSVLASNMTWVCSGALFAAAGMAAYWESSRAAALWDVSYVLEIAYRITLGLVPYRDFVLPQAPLTFLIQAGLMRVFDAGYVVQRIYCAVGAGVIAVLTFHIVHMLMPAKLGGRAPAYALFIAGPSIFLNGYVIIPWPWYDSDAALFTLVALAAILFARRPGASLIWHALAGALVILPALTKQNIGFAFVLLVHASLLGATVARRNAVEWRRYLVFLAGFGGAAIAIALVLHFSIGLPNIYRWTVTYASAKRRPSIGMFVSPYLRVDTWLAVAVTLGGYSLYRLAHGKGARLIAQTVGIAPWAFAARDVVWWSLAHRAHWLWGVGTLVGSPVALFDWFRDRLSFERAVPLIALGVAHAAFASQGPDSSAFGVWPLLLISLTPLAQRMLVAPLDESPRAAVYLVVVSIGLTFLGFLHVARNERLHFVDLAGVVQVSSVHRIRGLVVPGNHLSDFQTLIERTNQLISRDEGVVAFPGEDPFFIASGRVPRLPIVLFDDTAMPWDADELLAMLDRKGVNWVIVKEQLQLQSNPWIHTDTFLTDKLLKRFELVETLTRYRIFRRRAAILPASQ